MAIDEILTLCSVALLMLVFVAGVVLQELFPDKEPTLNLGELRRLMAREKERVGR